MVYCVQAGADTVVAEQIDACDEGKPGKPTTRQPFNEALEMGMRVEVCEQTANLPGIDADEQDELVEGGRIARLGSAHRLCFAGGRPTVFLIK